MRQRIRVLWLETLVFFGLRYRCRCGAIGRERDRAKHEQFHQAIREWMTPPTQEEIRQAFASSVSDTGETPT